MTDRETKVCSCCGAEIPARAVACRECGADDRTGWSDQVYLDGIDLGDDIDYDDIRSAEFSERKRPGSWVQMAVVALLLLLFIIMLVRLYL